MGVCCAFQSISDENIERLVRNPALVWKVLSPDDDELLLQELNKGRTFFDKLLGKNKLDVSSIPELSFVDGENESDDVDKSWHGMHYCLNKTESAAPTPKDFITEGGIYIGDVDVGYGPARAIQSNMLREIHNWLAPIDDAYLKSNYDISEMKKLDIYPDIWDEGEESFEYISTYFESLKAFVAQCVNNRLGMLVYFT